MQFKQITGYENYIVYENGQVMNINNGKVLKQNLVKDYLQITLYKNKNRKNYFIHSLVAQEFIGQKPEEFDTDHCDRNSLNNHYTNLRYISRSNNHKNKSSYKGNEAIYLDEISECCLEITEYNQHKFENYFLNPYTYEMFYYNNFQFRQLNLLNHNGFMCYSVRNKQNISIKISLNKLKNDYKVL
ncbi:Conserved_hypothetical protein [Hexamita inflata]|uniref:HNH nuclease domain-containing protein n=1 Tax=Hexamita inflata TaxID=28002 RepID=A0ABP1MD96_9EUKA